MLFLLLSGPIEQLIKKIKIVLGVQCREITLWDSSLSDGFLPHFLRFSYIFIDMQMRCFI